ncbi:MAG TPA: ABC transporter permease, partial [Firmicutes bacterium]|nr:ABC transporter permease [Bacillota bacterium]
MAKEKRWDLKLVLLLLPVILFISLLFIYPFFYGLFLSFTKGDGSFT